MKTHRTTPTNEPRKWMVWITLIGMLTISCAMALLWQRQQIERTAQSIRLLEQEMVKEERRLRYLDSKIAEIHQPLYLEQQIDRLGLALRPPLAGQIVFIEGQPQRRHWQQARAADVAVQTKRDPLIRAFDLAIIEAIGTRE